MSTKKELLTVSIKASSLYILYDWAKLISFQINVIFDLSFMEDNIGASTKSWVVYFTSIEGSLIPFRLSTALIWK